MNEADRKRILDSTAQVFLEKGFQRASTAEIARRARTSKQTLYGLFPSKSDLFVAVIRSHTDELFSHHIEYLESNAPPQVVLADMGRRTLLLFSAPRFLALYKILVAEAHNFPGLARELWQCCVLRGHRLLAEYLRSQRIGGPSYQKAAARFVSLILGNFLIDATLNPDLQLSESMLRARVREAVRDFLSLYPARARK
ncbi:MAG TPA: TetR/AcrR family transcriptional regulator [Terracidiphilus sp.]|nr:TetR/AcrR family transcriptional regulator [Terracidiphilus sp.]